MLQIQANTRLSHTPPSTSLCFTQAALNDCRSSNLVFRVKNGADDVRLSVEDRGVDSPGHRKRVLDPRYLEIASGLNDDWGAMKMFALADETLGRASPEEIPFLACPSQGPIPFNVQYGDWSLEARGIHSVPNSLKIIHSEGIHVPLMRKPRFLRFEVLHDISFDRIRP